MEDGVWCDEEVLLYMKDLIKRIDKYESLIKECRADKLKIERTSMKSDCMIESINLLMPSKWKEMSEFIITCDMFKRQKRKIDDLVISFDFIIPKLESQLEDLNKTLHEIWLIYSAVKAKLTN